MPRKLGGDGGSEIPESYSADGKLLVLSQESFETGFDLWILELDLTRRPFLTTLFDERSARLSPDGRFVAYSSNESGKYEIYATSLPRANDSSWSKEGTTPPPIDFTWS